MRKGAQLVWCPTNSPTQRADHGAEGAIENRPAFQGWVKTQWGPRDTGNLRPRIEHGINMARPSRNHSLSSIRWRRGTGRGGAWPAGLAQPSSVLSPLLRRGERKKKAQPRILCPKRANICHCRTEAKSGTQGGIHSASAWLYSTTCTCRSDPNRPDQDHRKGHSGPFALPPNQNPFTSRAVSPKIPRCLNQVA